MKKKVITTILAVAVAVAVAVAAITSSFLLGTTQAKTITVTKEIEKVVTVETPKEIPDSYINMNDITNFTANEYGLQLYFSDGSGYWLEK